MLSLRERAGCYHTEERNDRGTTDVLHVVEGVEEGIDELCGLHEEAGELVLHGGVDVVVLGRRDLKILFQLHNRHRRGEEVREDLR